MGCSYDRPEPTPEQREFKKNLFTVMSGLTVRCDICGALFWGSPYQPGYLYNHRQTCHEKPVVPIAAKATVILFKSSGKYYTEEEWTIPEKAIGPYDMIHSPDFRRIDGGAVLVETQEPWGYPHLFPQEVVESRNG